MSRWLCYDLVKQTQLWCHNTVKNAKMDYEISTYLRITRSLKCWVFNAVLLQNMLRILKWLIDIVLQYIPRNMHTIFALLCFVVVMHWLIFPYPSGLLHWHCGNLTIAPVPAKQPWWTWINTSCEFIMNDCITTTKQSTTKPCAYFLGYTIVWIHVPGFLWILSTLSPVTAWLWYVGSHLQHRSGWRQGHS